MMTTGAIIFWIASWTIVLGLTVWSFGMVLRGRRDFDPDGIGPAAPPDDAARGPGAGSASR